MKKLTWFFGAVFSLVSPVIGAGYRQAVNRTLNPDGLQEVRVAYEMLGWPVALLVALPLLVFFGYGFFLDMWKEKRYWHLLIASFFVSFAAFAMFPFLFQLV